MKKLFEIIIEKIDKGRKMYYFLFITLIVFGLFVKTRKNIYDIIVIAFLGFIVLTSKGDADFASYKVAYDLIGSGVNYDFLGVGWEFLCKIGNLIKLDYSQFKCVILILSILLIRSTVQMYVKNRKASAMVWAWYLVYPILLDCVQIRFFLAQAIIIFGIRYLIKGGIVDYMKYAFLVGIAYLFHSTSVFYLLFLFVPLFDKIRKYIPYIAIVASALIMVGKKYIVQIASVFISQNRIELYLGKNLEIGVGFIAYSLMLVLFAFLSEKLVKAYNQISIKENDLCFAGLTQKLNWLCVILIPLIAIDTNIIRLQRPLWILTYISFANYCTNSQYITIAHIKIPIKWLLLAIALVSLMASVVTFGGFTDFLSSDRNFM